MKKVLLLMVMLVATLTVNAQQFTVRRDADRRMIHLDDSIQYNEQSPVFKAGTYINKSASTDALSWGLAITSILFYTEGANSKDNQSTFRTIGFTFAVGAIVSRVYSISYKFKAGRELKISAGTAQLTF